MAVDKLIYQQQSLARQNNLYLLEQLDLATLLRIADQNWYELSLPLNLDKTVRNWLKEGDDDTRNHWAHALAEGLPSDMIYRDIDTLERLLQAFGTNAAALKMLNIYQRIKVFFSFCSNQHNQSGVNIGLLRHTEHFRRIRKKSKRLSTEAETELEAAKCGTKAMLLGEAE